MLMKFCPKCRALIEQGNSYCGDCQAKVADNKKATKAKYMKRYDQTKRNPIHVAFYNSLEWLTLRAVKLSRTNYLCERCKDKGVTTIATEVHHVITAKEEWDKRLDITNLRCLCKDCHNDAHARYRRNKKSKR